MADNASQKLTLSVYDASLDFPCGLHYDGKPAYVQDRAYIATVQMMNSRAILSIDIFNVYNVYISVANEKRGFALIRC